ncbi:hypothetical protein [Streptomyces sp. NBC_00055]|uniref:hypothetical protein n=1 Tax=Streptomyces sp. NBC_00055 TaxID=2975632 RepID=UPI0032517952
MQESTLCRVTVRQADGKNEEAPVVGRQCDGWVHSLRGHTVCFTGTILIDGERTVRKRCAAKAESLGATSKTDFSGKITLVVHGDLAGKSVSDTRRNYSSTLVETEREHRQGNHICVVDGDGFADLLEGFPTQCRELRRTPGGREPQLAPPRAGGDILGGPLRVQQVGQHTSDALTMDLNHLDKATAAHESTIGALIDHLTGQGVEVHSYARSAPRFDAGWSNGAEIFIAEVKSLTGASEDQQIRLGIGQVLDYAHQLRLVPSGRSVRPVLVLERKPADTRWSSLSEAVGIQLTWAPEFAGV